MSGEGLIDLATRYVRLSGELDATREAMKWLLLNGADEAPRPFSAADRRGPTGRGAEEAEQRIVELLKTQPGLGTSEVARETNANPQTAADRLKRLRKAGR
jgi:hypothetical protein